MSVNMIALILPKKQPPWSESGRFELLLFYPVAGRKLKTTAWV